MFSGIFGIQDTFWTRSLTPDRSIGYNGPLFCLHRGHKVLLLAANSLMHSKQKTWLQQDVAWGISSFVVPKQMGHLKISLENNEMSLYTVSHPLRRNTCIFSIFLSRDSNLLVMGVNDSSKRCLLMRHWTPLFADGVLLLLAVMIANIFLVPDQYFPVIITMWRLILSFTI